MFGELAAFVFQTKRLIDGFAEKSKDCVYPLLYNGLYNLFYRFIHVLYNVFPKTSTWVKILFIDSHTTYLESVEDHSLFYDLVLKVHYQYRVWFINSLRNSFGEVAS